MMIKEPIFLTDIKLNNNIYGTVVKKEININMIDNSKNLRDSFDKKDKEFEFENSCHCCGVDLVRYKYFTSVPLKHLLCPTCDKDLTDSYDKKTYQINKSIAIKFVTPYIDNTKSIDSMESFLLNKRNETVSLFRKANKVDMVSKIRIEDL